MFQSFSKVVSKLFQSFLKVRTAIPMILGANIGTSVTNTIVSFTQMQNRDEFKRYEQPWRDHCMLANRLQ